MQAEHKLQQTKLGKLNATIQKDQREEQAKMMALRDDAQLSHGIKDSLEQRGLPTLMDKDDEAAPPTAQAVPAADAAGGHSINTMRNYQVLRPETNWCIVH